MSNDSTPQPDITPEIAVPALHRGHLRATAVACILYALYWQAVRIVSADSIGVIIASTLVSLVLTILIAAEIGRLLQSVPRIVMAVALCGAVIGPMRYGVAVGRMMPPWSLISHLPALPDLFFIGFAAALGALVSRLLRGANMIPPVAAALGLVDIWTVLLNGPVHRVLASHSQAAQGVAKALTVALPAPAASSGAAPMTVVGFADYLFIAFFVSALTRFSGDTALFRRNVIALSIILSLYMSIAMATSWALPALVPMAVAMIAVNWRCFHYERSEVFALLYAGLFIGLILGLFWWFGPSVNQPQQPAR